MIDRLAPYVFAAIIGALLFYVSPLYPTTPISYPEIIVPAARIIENEPDTVVRWRERIVTRVVEPDVVAESEGGGEPEVATFCASFAQERVDSAVATMTGDTVFVERERPRRLLLRSASHDPGYFGRPDRLVFTGPLSTGGLRQLSYTSRGGWSARATGDSLIFRQPRLQVLKDYGELGIVGLIGYVLGRAF